jgi:hypothetical protein
VLGRQLVNRLENAPTELASLDLRSRVDRTLAIANVFIDGLERNDLGTP